MEKAQTIMAVIQTLRGLFTDKDCLKGIEDWDKFIGCILLLEKVSAEIQEENVEKEGQFWKMADKQISALPAAESVGIEDIFVLEQSNQAKKLRGQTLINDLLTALDGHGGIQSITWTSSGTAGDDAIHT